MKRFVTATTASSWRIAFPAILFGLLFIFITGTGKAQWNTNTSVNLQISSLEAADMETAPTSDGKTWIAFYALSGGNYDMRAQLLDANGYKLLGPDGVLVSNQPSGSSIWVFNICVDASNNLIIANQDLRTSNPQAVVYKISEAGTHLWSSSGIVLGEGLAPYPAVLSTGEVIVAWIATTGNTLNLQKITTGGSLAWTNPIAVTVGGVGTTRGQVIANTSGKFTMVYQKQGTGISTTLYAQMFDNSGTALYSPLQICDQTTAAVRYYSIAGQADTTFFGYYSSVGLRFNSFLQRINPGGTIPWGMNGSNFNTNVGTNDYYQMETAINLSPSSGYVWAVCTFSTTNQSQYGVYIQKFLRTTGARQFTDNAKIVYAVSTNGDRQCGDLALVNDQPMFMNEDANYKLYATRLNGSGNFVWPGNRVELSSTTATQSTPKMRFGFTPDGPNRCAGTWTENRGTQYMGYAQGISVGGLIGLVVATQGSVPATITIPGGTLQMVATVYPASASQSVTWSIVPVTGMATITTGGLVTGVTDGTVYAKAVSVQDPTVMDSLLITISNQVPLAPTVVTLAATNVVGTTATLNGLVTANGATTTVTFNWGLTAAYGNTVSATPSTVTGGLPTPVYANLTSLTPVTTYHYRCVGVNSVGTTYGSDMTFTTCQPPDPAGAITGPTTVCQSQTGVTYSTPAIQYATSYTWTVPTGATIVAGAGTNQITVDFSSTAVSGNVTVAGTNSCTTGPSSTLAVTVNAVPVPTISGPNSYCLGTGTVNYTTESGMTNYLWTISTGGTIVSGSGTNSIEVQWDSTGLQNVTVNYTNSGGCQAPNPSLVSVFVSETPAAAGPVTGDTVLCANTTGHVYSVAPIQGANTYVWTTPPGTTIVSGGGTNTITVDYSSVATSGSVTVMGNSVCGNGASSSLVVTVNPIPPTPVVDSSGVVLTSSAPEGNQWYQDGEAIPGATGQEYTVSQTGEYWTVVTLDGCSSEESNHILMVFTGVEETKQAGCRIYPVPNNGRFTVSLTGLSGQPVSFDIYNILGIKIYTKEFPGSSGTMNRTIDLGKVQPGIYTLVVTEQGSRKSKQFTITAE